jgi:1,4-dihydroxy-2-naphthoyl-CoA hydrolase
LARVTVDQIKRYIPGTFPGDLGIEPLEVSDERARGRIEVEKRHLHPGGYVHGGVWTALADTVAAWVTWRNIPDGADFTTVELKLNVFSAAVAGDEIEAVATPLHVGRTTVVAEAKLTKRSKGSNPGERPAGHFVLTQLVLHPEGERTPRDARVRD